MTTITTGRSRTLWVEVAPDAKNFRPTVYSGIKYIDYDTQMNVWANGNFELPEGQWEFLSLLKDVTEEGAAQIVEREDGYDAYKEYYKDGNFVNIKAIHSLSSLMMDNNIDSSKSWAILIETKK